jgi:hypothetical protein
VLHVLDPQLPLMACKAAIELDNFLLGTTTELKAARTLADQLKNSIQCDRDTTQRRSLMDPATLTIVASAASGTATQRVTQVELLLKYAEDIAELLIANDLHMNKSKVKSARSFFLALSRSVSAYRRSILDLRPSHPFRS